jgi:hypothetical protein
MEVYVLLEHSGEYESYNASIINIFESKIDAYNAQCYLEREHQKEMEYLEDECDCEFEEEWYTIEKQNLIKSY